jgi:hypothetical protein
MHERHDIEKKLKPEAVRISKEIAGGAPIVIIVGGGGDDLKIPRTMIASSFGAEQKGRLRDILGILQAAIQYESWKHFNRKKSPKKDIRDDKQQS